MTAFSTRQRIPVIATDCPTCAGRGFLDEDYADARGEHQTREVPCPTCDDDDPRDEGPLEPEDLEWGAEAYVEPRDLP